MLLVPRCVRKANDPEKPHIKNSPKALSQFGKQAAWILLGEPGAGKTSAFKKESETAGGQYLSIADFIYTDEISEWQDKTLFLDGLDEIRASSGGESILCLIREQLKRLGKPSFRIACRAADWFGSSDREDIKGASSDGEITVLLLEPLPEDDTFAILRENHGIENPAAFIEEAQKRGVANLLDNPQTLGLLASAIRDGQWPTTRQGTFQLACEKLAEESNKRHRNIKRNRPESTGKLLDAAGHLCAVLLLSDKTGIALDSGQANIRFPCLDDCTPPERDAAHEAVRTKLFRPEKEECFIPSHRSIAEYLAARWLAAHIDGSGLSLRRILNLMLGKDGRTIAGLRGLYGWLALHCQAARTHMIEADPLTVIIYGDTKPFPLQDKRLILASLQREAEYYFAFHTDVSSSHSFGALAEPQLIDDFIAALESPLRDEAAQFFAYCVLKTLAEGEAIPELASAIKNVILDDTRWGVIRQSALQNWLRLTTTSHEALAMLDAIRDGVIIDDDDALAGRLLYHLYPEHIAAENLLQYLHVPKDSHLIGSFVLFWEHELLVKAPKSHLPVILDQLIEDPFLSLSNINEFHLNRIISAIVTQGVLQHGEDVSNERLFSWLGIGADKYGNSNREESGRQQIAGWLEAHPENYKALLLLCFNHCGNDENLSYCINIYMQRLHGATVPNDLGLWHLEQAGIIDNSALAQIHLAKAIDASMYQQGNQGLSLEKIEAWGDTHTERKHWLPSLLVWDIPEWKITDAVKNLKDEQQRAQNRQVRTKLAIDHIPAILSGNAPVGFMRELAGVWAGIFPKIIGDSPIERFNNYCNNGQEILFAAEIGFIRSLERTDLPTVAEIIDLAINHKEHLIHQPCLIGMELRWKQGQLTIDSLSDDVLSRILAFQLTYYGSDTPDWFTHLVIKRPILVAKILIDYTRKTLRSKQRHINYIYQLEHDSNYREVAIQAVPTLLANFPARAKTNLLHYLGNLLKSALRYHADQLNTLIKRKTALKSMNVTQKIYWLAAGMLLNPKQYETDLWCYIGNSWHRACYLSAFLGGNFTELNKNHPFLVNTVGRLIEILTPHAELEWSRGGGSVTNTMQRGDTVRTLVSRFVEFDAGIAIHEIDRLLALPPLAKLKFSLENTRHQLQLKQRENEFRFLPLNGVAKILANKEPANTADLATLALDHLDDIAREIRQENDDGFRAFWNVENKKPISKREENYCRDTLLYRLRAHLGPLGIDCQPEGDYFNDKRADIRLSYRNKFELPIEIKRDDNKKSLWSGLHSQLIGQYSIAPGADGYGIYLVLWFDGKGIPAAPDGKEKPRTPEELQVCLEAQLNHAEQQQISVRVIDVSWPISKKST